MAASEGVVVLKPKLIIAVVLGFLAAIVLVQNTQVATLYFLFWEISMSQIIVIFFSLLTGFLIGYLVALLRKRKSY